MQYYFSLTILPIIIFVSCKQPQPQSPLEASPAPQGITCTTKGCSGAYEGPEFVNGSDVAHQFSNTMCREVGDQLKALYRQGQFVQVDFPRIQMTTQGMGTGTVRYYVSIPFKRVADSCQAFTAFDHVGGWNHAPALTQRMAQLQPALMEGEQLYLSELRTTPEGLQEYWIQWRHATVQQGCGLKIED